MRWSDIDTLACPVAQAMAVIGDSWTVLILRDAVRGATRFDQFLRSTHASRAIISERLSRLLEHGVFERVQYETRPPRYEYRLTARGEALKPVMMMLAHWGETQIQKSAASTRRHTACGHKFKPVIHCSECGESLEPGSVTFEARPRLKIAAR